MSDQTIILLASLAAGVAGTGLGGLLGVFLGDAGRGFLPRVLGFAGGIMVGVSLFDLVPQSFSSLLAGGLKTQTALICLICSVGAGAVAVALAEKLSDAIMSARHKTFATTTTKEKSVVQTVSPLSRRAVISAIADAQSGTTAKSMLRTGIIMAVAIALHNFPEGLAIGAAGSAETAGGIAVALTIALHNVPEGMSVAAPLAGGGVKKGLAVAASALTGAATVLGAVAGVFLGAVNVYVSAVCLGLAAGAMLYVSFAEVFAETYSASSGKPPCVSIMLGVLSALALGAI